MLCFQVFTYVRTASFSNARTLCICTVLFIRQFSYLLRLLQFFIRNQHFHFSHLYFLRPFLPFFCPQIKYDIFVKCYWVDTRWQQYSTHLHTNSTQVGFTLFIGREGLQGDQRYSSTLFQTSALKGGEGSASPPVRFLPPVRTRYPSYRRLFGPQGRSGRRKISPPPGFDPRTVQPVVSRYTE